MTLKLAVPTAAAVLVVSAMPNAAVAQTGNQAAQAQPASPPSGSPGQTAGSAVDGGQDHVVSEAADALQETQNAIAAIDGNKPDDAVAALARATGKIEIVLARTPDLALATVDASLVTHDVIATEADVEKLRGTAAAALAEGHLQLARRLIADLASETVVSITKLPLGTYPAALKQAAALLNDGKPQAARAVLQTTLGTLVIDDVIIPLPLVRAQAALEEARGLLEKKKRSEAESEQLRALLATSLAQLRLGRALGYATDDEMSDLIATVIDIQHRTEGSASAKGLLDPVGAKFAAARQSSQPPK